MASMDEELDAVMARAGIVVPAERRAPLLASYAELLEQIALLRQTRDHTAEPSNVYSMVGRVRR